MGSLQDGLCSILRGSLTCKHPLNAKAIFNQLHGLLSPFEPFANSVFSRLDKHATSSKDHLLKNYIHKWRYQMRRLLILIEQICALVRDLYMNELKWIGEWMEEVYHREAWH